MCATSAATLESSRSRSATSAAEPRVSEWQSRGTSRRKRSLEAKGAPSLRTSSARSSCATQRQQRDHRLILPNSTFSCGKVAVKANESGLMCAFFCIAAAESSPGWCAPRFTLSALLILLPYSAQLLFLRRLQRRNARARWRPWYTFRSLLAFFILVASMALSVWLSDDKSFSISLDRLLGVVHSCIGFRDGSKQGGCALALGILRPPRNPAPRD